jgi:excisionase family DNA binding protein
MMYIYRILRGLASPISNGEPGIGMEERITEHAEYRVHTMTEGAGGVLTVLLEREVPDARPLDKLLLREPEARDILGLSRSTMFQLLRKGEIASVIVGKTSRRIPLTALRAYVERLQTTQAASVSAVHPRRTTSGDSEA